MPDTKVVAVQTDFSAGEVDVSAKRDIDHPITKAGARQCANWRILNSRKLTNRPGRRALFVIAAAGARVDEILMAPGQTFFLHFGNSLLQVFDANFVNVFSQVGPGWSVSTAKSIVWARYDKSIYIAFPGAVPLVLTWDGASTWTLAVYDATIRVGGQKRTVFYRVAPKNITMQPSATTGNITVTFSANVLTAAAVGARLRWHNRQITITGFLDASHCNATVNEQLYVSQRVGFTTNVNTIFAVGDIIVGQILGARGYITNFPSASQVDVVLSGPAGPGTFGFQGNETVIGPSGSAIVAAGAVAIIAPPASPVWDEELVTHGWRGFPQSVFVDQGRLGFCNLPSVPNGIAYSTFGDPNDLYVGANPTDAIFETAPENAQVFFVVPGPESSEFIFAHNGIWYIPITANNPLVPGSIGFQRVSSDGCANIQPRAVAEAIIYINAGSQVCALFAFGAQNRPYKTDDLSILRDHLFIDPIAIAVPTTAGQFPERYAYVLNSDGTIIVGKYSIDPAGRPEGLTGWIPWTSAFPTSWITALGSDVVFTTSTGGLPIVERLDSTLYLDAAMFVNAAPVPFTPPPGKGPLWWIAGQTVDLMDQSTRMMGTYQIDANGFIVPQGNGGEDLAAATLVAGQKWNATLEPFIPPVQVQAGGGQDVGQRMWKRKLHRFQLYVQESTGFVLQRLYGGDAGPNAPAPGTVMKERRIATWNVGENPTLPPILREQSYHDRPIGRSFDPREAVVKDTPGPLTIIEATSEVGV